MTRWDDDEEQALAWAAGLFEGEGTILLRKGGRGVKLELSMTDPDVVFRFNATVGCGNTYGPYAYEKSRNWKPYMRWYAGKRDEVQALLEDMLPYLGERRAARAKEALAYLNGDAPKPI